MDSDNHRRSTSPDMATMVLHGTTAGITKRYRPAPAKTFQCRGYGECRMVFSRSEHLARHIRKHTGERPFTCHCGKQFSRLDNLRQHAQTVHADKQDQNERMMRDLTSLHASMAAASKSGQPRGSKRSQTTASSGGSGSASGSPAVPATPSNLVKQEDPSQSTLPMHQRPGTSTGYEGTEHQSGILYQPAWHVHTSSDSRPTNNSANQSFRDHHQHPGQSFLAPPAPGPTTNSSSNQSFLSFSSATYSFSLSDNRGDGRPGSSSSRPPTSDSSYPRSLPPLASVVPQTILPPSSQQPQQQQQQQQQHPSFPPNLFPFPGFRRPSTANRPGTAPASVYGGPGMVSRAELPFLYGRDHMAAAPTHHSFASYDPDDSHSPNAGPSYDSPFSFHPPALSDTQPSTVHLSAFTAYAPGFSPPNNPRKRPLTGPDGPEPEQQYDYGSESRPQSRRLTVMELCNDTTPAVLPLPGLGPSSSSSRPGTSSGLSSSASALALVDRSPTLSYAGGVFGRSAAPTGDTDASAGGGARGGGAAAAAAMSTEAQFGGISALHAGGVHASSGVAHAVLSPIRGSPILSDGYSSRSSPHGTRSPASGASQQHALAHAAAHVTASRVQSESQPSSPDAIPRRGGAESELDQVRIAVPAAHNTSPTPVGMRV